MAKSLFDIVTKVHADLRDRGLFRPAGDPVCTGSYHRHIADSIEKSIRSQMRGWIDVLREGSNQACQCVAKGADALADIRCRDTGTPVKTWCATCQSSVLLDALLKKGNRDPDAPKPRVKKPGQTVYIEGKPTKLKTKLKVDGGWIVHPPIDDCRYWNEDQMKLRPPRKKK